MANTALTTYAAALKADMADSGLTQEELARRIDTKQQTVSGWLRGKSVPRPVYHDKLVAVLGRHCRISAIPKRGEYRVLLEAKNGYVEGDSVVDVESVQYSPRPAPHVTTGYGEKLTALFNRLPDDEVLQAMVFAQCAQAIFALLSPAPTQAQLAAPERAPQRE